ncbi:hypothetical protein GCM10022247_28920 [Allokutzneria multivorans]|uniref:Uncharacterized protein n=1 Tax=Allokutzneria multivorans TaxID=1142134 RepID=A0ABP7S251_9PSEU
MAVVGPPVPSVVVPSVLVPPANASFGALRALNGSFGALNALKGSFRDLDAPNGALVWADVEGGAEGVVGRERGVGGWGFECGAGLGCCDTASSSCRAWAERGGDVQCPPFRVPDGLIGVGGLHLG